MPNKQELYSTLLLYNICTSTDLVHLEQTARSSPNLQTYAAMLTARYGKDDELYAEIRDHILQGQTLSTSSTPTPSNPYKLSESANTAIQQVYEALKQQILIKISKEMLESYQEYQTTKNNLKLIYPSTDPRYLSQLEQIKYKYSTNIIKLHSNLNSYILQQPEYQQLEEFITENEQLSGYHQRQQTLSTLSVMFKHYALPVLLYTILVIIIIPLLANQLATNLITNPQLTQSYPRLNTPTLSAITRIVLTTLTTLPLIYPIYKYTQKRGV